MIKTALTFLLFYVIYMLGFSFGWFLTESNKHKTKGRSKCKCISKNVNTAEPHLIRAKNATEKSRAICTAV